MMPRLIQSRPHAASCAGGAVVDPFTAAALANSELLIRPLREQITLRDGLMTLRGRPLIGEAAALAQGTA